MMSSERILCDHKHHSNGRSELKEEEEKILTQNEILNKKVKFNVHLLFSLMAERASVVLNFTHTRARLAHHSEFIIKKLIFFSVSFVYSRPAVIS